MDDSTKDLTKELDALKIIEQDVTLKQESCRPSSFVDAFPVFDEITGNLETGGLVVLQFYNITNDFAQSKRSSFINWLVKHTNAFRICAHSHSTKLERISSAFGAPISRFVALLKLPRLMTDTVNAFTLNFTF